jgi:peroxiredoxin
MAAIVLAAPAAPADSPPGDTTRVGEFALNDTRGVRHTPGDWAGHKAIVLFFLATDCPVANGYTPEMARLARRYAPAGVAVWGVHPDPEVSPDVAVRHAKEYALEFPVLLDPCQSLTRQTGVSRTPEAVILSPAGTVLYRGRIDNRYSPGGKRRHEPTTNDLEAALRAVLGGRPVAVARTAAYGCPLPLPATPEGAKAR